MSSRKSTIFNSKFARLGQENKLDKAALGKAQAEVTSEFCEQFLLFDKVCLKADRVNYSLYYLILEFGLNTVQEYLERGLIELLLWTPVIVTSTGSMREDGSIDRGAVIGKPPIVSGQLVDRDRDPDYNVETILKHLNIPKNRINSFKKATRSATIIPNAALATQSVDLTVDAYVTGKLTNLGLANDKSPEDLDVDERLCLLGLSQDVLETSILAQYEYKSFNEYSYTEISDRAFDSIANALNVKENSKTILNLDNVPDLKSLFLSRQLNKEDVKALRYKSSAKAFRKWLNEVSANNDCSQISKEYLNEVTGKNNFWDTPNGKIVKNIGMLGIGSALGSAIGGLTLLPVVAGAIASKGAELGLGLFDSFFLDGLLKGKHPRMFVEEVEKRIQKK